MPTTTTSLAPGAAAPDVLLETLDGASVALAQFWLRQPVLLFFVRNLGCVFCRDQLARLRDRYADIQALGAEVVAITPSDSVSARRLAQELRLPFPTLADLRRQSYRLYGLFETTLVEIVRPEVVVRTMQQLARGNIPKTSPFNSSFTQVGGLFVVDTLGVVRFSHIASPVFDYPAIDDCLAVLGDLSLV